MNRAPRHETTEQLEQRSPLRGGERLEIVPLAALQQGGRLALQGSTREVEVTAVGTTAIGLPTEENPATPIVSLTLPQGVYRRPARARRVPNAVLLEERRDGAPDRALPSLPEAEAGVSCARGLTEVLVAKLATTRSDCGANRRPGTATVARTCAKRTGSAFPTGGEGSAPIARRPDATVSRPRASVGTVRRCSRRLRCTRPLSADPEGRGIGSIRGRKRPSGDRVAKPVCGLPSGASRPVRSVRLRRRPSKRVRRQRYSRRAARAGARCR